MLKNLLLPLFFLGWICSSAQSISGSISDGNTVIAGANVYWVKKKVGVISDAQGQFSISKQENDSLCVSFLGYKNACFASQNISSPLKVVLQASSIETQEVEITAKMASELRSTQMSMQEIELKQVEALPAFLGEVDILKSIQLLPGVQSSGEGNSGYYVRGGGPDQNLILLDKAPVYNASHLLGFFSIFNHEAIENPTLIKGGMPAQYGNRLASVLSIPSSTGDFNDHSFSGGVGLIASRFSANGPIVNDKLSYLVSGRRTYLDAVAGPFIPDDAQAKGSAYFFYDINAKITYKISEDASIEASIYQGDDVFTYVNRKSEINLRIPWGNTVVQSIYKKRWNDRLKSDVYAYYNKYQFGLYSEFDQFSVGVLSSIKEYSLGSDWNYRASDFHQLNYGIQLSRNIYLPSFAEASSGDTDFDTGERNQLHSNQMALYLEDNWTITPLLSVRAGLRYSLFQHIGPFTRFLEPEAGSNSPVLQYPSNDVIAQYQGIEPRFSARYVLDENQSIKASYTHNIQYLHLASISPVSLPTDIWMPSTSKIKPQRGNQYAVGYFFNIPKWKSEASVEAYYKDMKNLVEYKENTNPEDNLNDNVDNQLVQGRGFSYGLELFMKRRFGPFNGWLGYTISSTQRVFEEFNEGSAFPAKYDRTHDLALVATYELNEQWTFGANFVYGTGNAISLPTTRYFSFFDGRVLGVYNGRNTFRMPAYHRFDISATYRPKKSMNKKFKTWWVFGIYNVYSRQNPYFLYFDVEGKLGSNNLKLSAKQVSLFPILPAVSWNFAF